MKDRPFVSALVLLLAGALLVPVAQAQPRAGTNTGAPGAIVPQPKASDGYSRTMDTQTCTTAARSTWLPEDEMRLLAEHRGYRIKTFRADKNNCYEVYGFDRQNRVVEAYFDPVTSRLVHQNIAN